MNLDFINTLCVMLARWSSRDVVTGCGSFVPGTQQSVVSQKTK